MFESGQTQTLPRQSHRGGLGKPDTGRVNMRRASGELNLADDLTKGKTWCEIDWLVRGVGDGKKVIGAASSLSILKPTCAGERCSFRQISGAPCGRSDVASERYRQQQRRQARQRLRVDGSR